MADFYPVLSRAIAGLSENTPEARRAVYDRAMTVLVAQLRGMNPPVSETEIARQRLALQEAITRIEREQALPPFDDAGLGPEAQPREGLREPSPQRETPPEATRLQRDALHEPAGEDSPGSDAELAGGAMANAPAAAGRPRLDIARAQPRRALPWRGAVVVGGVGLVIGAIAFTAYTVNQAQPPDTPPPVQTTQPVQPTPGGKISERAGESGATPQSPAPAAPAQQMPAPPQSTQPGPVPSAPGGVSVAQRAVIYIEPADASQQPRAIQGRATWRVETGGATQGRRIETVLRADVDFAEIGLALTFTIRRNEDAAFPASHIVGMRFTRSSDDGNGAVREAGVPQFKTEETERGAPLAGITSALGENLFVTALSRVDVELNRNLDVMRTRNWIDIPVRFASGRRAIIAFEKGVSGEQRLAEAMRAWQQ